MALEMDHACPDCGGTRTFYRVASMILHLGEKTKWCCPECDYKFVRIEGAGIDSSTADA